MSDNIWVRTRKDGTGKPRYFTPIDSKNEIIGIGIDGKNFYKPYHLFQDKKLETHEIVALKIQGLLVNEPETRFTTNDLNSLFKEVYADKLENLIPLENSLFGKLKK